MEKFIIQKAQKITSALYLITDLIKDSDSIKWEIREEGIALVSSALMLNTSYAVEKEHALRLFLSTSDKLLSFLNICLISSVISNMNATIVINEIQSIVDYIKKEQMMSEKSLPGYILSDEFFATDDSNKLESVKVKGQVGTGKITGSSVSKNTSVGGDKNIRQTTRKDDILNLLKKESNLTIKDFAKVIKDCSEKTIQRELISLVKEGVVKRAGERRWSTYSLAQP
jgi:hypothetical protein